MQLAQAPRVAATALAAREASKANLIEAGSVCPKACLKNRVRLEHTGRLRELRSQDIETTFRVSRPEILNRRRPMEEYLMDNHTETIVPKLVGTPMADAQQAFREMTEKGTTQAKETYERMSATTTEAADVIKTAIRRRLRVCRITTTRSSNSLKRTPTPRSALSRRCPV
jgi:hypothetical protein